MSNISELMAHKACAAMKNAYAPYSKFHVGAGVQAEDDTLFVGCNVENAVYGPTNCAERKVVKTITIAELLPDSFGPESLI